jgi:hypothetical protein
VLFRLVVASRSARVADENNSAPMSGSSPKNTMPSQSHCSALAKRLDCKRTFAEETPVTPYADRRFPAIRKRNIPRWTGEKVHCGICSHGIQITGEFAEPASQLV